MFNLLGKAAEGPVTCPVSENSETSDQGQPFIPVIGSACDHPVSSGIFPGAGVYISPTSRIPALTGGLG